MKKINIKCTNPKCDYIGDMTTIQPPFTRPEETKCPKCNKLTLIENN